MSRFRDHSREELFHALAQSREHVRGTVARDIDTEDLRIIVEETFIGLPMPLRPPVLTEEEYEKMNRGIRRLQIKVRELIRDDWVGPKERARRRQQRENAIIPAVTNFLQEALMESISAPNEGFKNWERYELIRAIVDLNVVQLREESTISVDTLQNLATELFYGLPIPPKREMPPRDEILRMDRACRTIQHCYRRRYYMNAITTMMKKIREDRAFQDEGIDMPEEVNTDKRKGWMPLKTKWEAPSVQKAEHFADMNHPRVKVSEKFYRRFSLCETTTGRLCALGGFGEQCDLWREGKWSEFTAFGPGVTMYFKFVKWAFWLFIILSCFAMPSLIINLFGPESFLADIGIRSHTLSDLARTTVGNLYIANETVSGIIFPFCSGEGNVYNVDCYLDKTYIANLYTWLDIAGLFIFVIAFIWLVHFETQEDIDMKHKNKLASAYTIEVHNLPESCDESEIKDHFENLTLNKVANVVIVYNSEDEIRSYKRRGLVIKQLERKQYECLYYRHLLEQEREKAEATEESISGAELSIQKTQEEIESLRKEITAIEKCIAEKHHPLKKGKIGSSSGKPELAFVVFELESTQVDAIKKYDYGFFDRFYMPEEMLFKGCKLIVSKAPEPSILIWENLTYKLPERLFRRTLSTFSVFFLLAITVFITFVSRVVEQWARDAGGTEECPMNWKLLSHIDQRTVAANNNALLHCYCDKTRNARDSMCSSYLEYKVWSTLITIASTFVVALINYLMELVISYFADFEKHRTITKKELSIFLRLFLLRCINMGFVFLINEDRYHISSFLGLTYNHQRDMTTEWYFTVGTSVMLVQLQNIMFVFYNLYFYFSKERAKKTSVSNPFIALSQYELNQIYLGPKFELSSRYADVLSIIFVCYMYSTSMPLLLLIGALFFILTYFIDKYLFINYYRTPPRYTTEVSKLATSLLKYVMLVHVIMSLWTMCERDIFESDNVGVESYTGEVSKFDPGTFEGLVTQQHTLPLLILILLILICIIFKDYLSVFSTASSKIMKHLFRLKIRDVSEEVYIYHKHKEAVVTYSEALKSGRFKTLGSYNILQNPKYQGSFGITDTWAKTHQHIGSLRFFHNQFDNTEDDVEMQVFTLEGTVHDNAEETSLEQIFINEISDVEKLKKKSD